MRHRELRGWLALLAAITCACPSYVSAAEGNAPPPAKASGGPPPLSDFDPQAIELRVCQAKVDDNGQWWLLDWLVGPPDGYLIVDGFFNETTHYQRVVEFTSVKDGQTIVHQHTSVAVGYDRRGAPLPPLTSAEFSVAYFRKGGALSKLIALSHGASSLLSLDPTRLSGFVQPSVRFLDDALKAAGDQRLGGFHTLTMTKTGGHFTVPWGWAMEPQRGEHVTIVAILNLVGGAGRQQGFVSCNDANQNRELKRTLDGMKVPVP